MVVVFGRPGCKHVIYHGRCEHMHWNAFWLKLELEIVVF